MFPLDPCSYLPLLSRQLVGSSVAKPDPRGERRELLGGPGFQQFTLVQVSPQDKEEIWVLLGLCGFVGLWMAGLMGVKVARYPRAPSV